MSRLRPLNGTRSIVFPLAAGAAIVLASSARAQSEPSPAARALAAQASTPAWGGRFRPEKITSPVGPVASKPLKYYGGRVLGNVEVVQVLWGNGCSTDVATKLGDLYKAATGAYLDMLGEYDTVGRQSAGPSARVGTNQRIGRGSFKTTVKITPKNTSTSLTDDDVGAELVAQIDAGVLPMPTTDAQGNYQTLYMIDFPSSVMVGDSLWGSSCNTTPVQGQAFCSYHGAITYKNGKSIAYAVLPDVTAPTCNGCGGDSVAFNNVTTIHAHELAEAITDPEIDVFLHQHINDPNVVIDYPIGWYADGGPIGGEVADICDVGPAQAPNYPGYTTEASLPGTAYQVHNLWSERLGACVSTPKLPTCDGSARPCTPCAGASDCGAAKPICDAALGGVCRACAADGDCAAPIAKCDKTAGSANAGRCVACLANADCSGVTPTCDAATNACRACAANADCGGSGVCVTGGAADLPRGACVQCLLPTDCAAGSTCDPVRHTCSSPGGSDGGAAGGDGGASNGEVNATASASCAAAPGRAPAGGLAAGVLALAAAAARRRRRRGSA